MKICSSCHNIVPDDDGLMDGDRFYCKSGGRQKEHLGEVFENKDGA